MPSLELEQVRKARRHLQRLRVAGVDAGLDRVAEERPGLSQPPAEEAGHGGVGRGPAADRLGEKRELFPAVEQTGPEEISGSARQRVHRSVALHVSFPGGAARVYPRKTQLAAQALELAGAVEQRERAPLGEEPIVLVGAELAAGALGRLDDDGIRSPASQLVRRGEPGGAGAGDHEHAHAASASRTRRASARAKGPLSLRAFATS